MLSWRNLKNFSRVTYLLLWIHPLGNFTGETYFTRQISLPLNENVPWRIRASTSYSSFGLDVSFNYMNQNFVDVWFDSIIWYLFKLYLRLFILQVLIFRNTLLWLKEKILLKNFLYIFLYFIKKDQTWQLINKKLNTNNTF